MFKLISNGASTSSCLKNLCSQSSRLGINRWLTSDGSKNNDNSVNNHDCMIDVDVSSEPPIPLYQRFNESIEVKRARLLYQSRKRGMLENDLLLSTFAHRYLDKFTHHELDTYDSLINSPSNDWDLFYWVVGKKETPPAFNHSIMEMLKEHAKNHAKENRTRQPPLY